MKVIEYVVGLLIIFTIFVLWQIINDISKAESIGSGILQRIVKP